MLAYGSAWCVVLKPGAVIERYVVEEVLGQGGTAVVYRVRHRKLGTEHALKVLTWMGAQAEVRLLLEGRVQAGLRHPNVVAVTDILDLDSGPGLLMEYIPPPTLSKWLDDNEPSHAEMDRIFRAIVAGVNHAHKHGLVHRDLKPSNVLMQPFDGVLIPKVADFGLAKMLSDDPAAQNTRSGLTMGTPQYMAPEQFRDAKTVDRRADLFSLGCILYELVAGFPPFEYTDFIRLYNTILARAYRPLPAGTPPGIVAAVDGCLDPDRDTRIGDCTVLMAVLDGRPRPSVPTLIPGDAVHLLPRIPEGAVPVSTRRAPSDVGIRTVEGGPPINTAIPGGGETGIPRHGGTLEPGSVPASGGVTWSDAAPTMRQVPPVPELAAAARAVEDVPPAPVKAPSSPPTRPWKPTDSATTMLPENSFTPRPAPRPKSGRSALATLFIFGAVGLAFVGVVTAGVLANIYLQTGGAAALSVPEAVISGNDPNIDLPPVDPSVEQKAVIEVDTATAKPEKPQAPSIARPGHPKEGKPPSTEHAVTTGHTADTAAAKPAPPPPDVLIQPPDPVVTAPTLVASSGLATVSVSGDAEAVLLVGTNGRFPPGEVPVGHYDVLASFPGMAYAKAGTIDVVGGQSVRLNCSAAFAQCSRR